MKHIRIMEYLEKLLKSNELKQGERLPSIRTLSDEFSCSKSTVLRAYQELENQHKVYAIKKSGYYKVEPNSNLKKSINNTIDFRTVLPDQSLLPYKEFSHSMSRAIELYKDILFSYGDAAGLDLLRNSMCEKLMESNVYTKVENIHITSGAQQAINILCLMRFPSGKTSVLIEQPTYSVILRLLEKYNIPTETITRTCNGIDLDVLEEKFKAGHIKFYYTMGRHHNPLGASLSEHQKNENR